METTGSRSQRAARRAAAGLLAAFLFVLPFSSSIALRNALLALAIPCVAWGFAGRAAPGASLPPWRVLAPILAWTAWCAASYAWSVDPAYTLGELRPGLLYPSIVFLLFHAATSEPEDIDRWAWALAAGLAVLGLIAVAQKAGGGPWDPRRWHGDTGSFATHGVLALPLVAWAFLRAGPRLRALAGAIGAVTLLASAWNDNRIAWAAYAAMTVLAAAVARPWMRPEAWRRTAAFAVVAVAAFAAMFALSAQYRSDKLEGTANEARAQFAHDPRLEIWRFALARAGEAPWAGHGFGREILRREFRAALPPGAGNASFGHAHNTAANVVLQVGAIGLALFAWMVGALVREMALGLGRGPPWRYAALLGLALVAGFAVRNLTDDFLTRHNALLAWSLAGAVLGALRAPAGATSARTPA